MGSVKGNEYPAESPSSYATAVDEDGNEFEVAPAIGQRWNGNNLPDCREALTAAAIRADIPRKAKLMVEIATAQIIRAERANLYRTVTLSQSEANKREIHQPFIDLGDQRTEGGIGKDVGLYVSEDGHIADRLPSEWANDDRGVTWVTGNHWATEKSLPPVIRVTLRLKVSWHRWTKRIFRRSQQMNL